MSKLKPIYGTTHLNVRKYHPDVPAALECPYCFVGVGSFNDLEARILDHFDGT
jgi:hypothetical protein